MNNKALKLMTLLSVVVLSGCSGLLSFGGDPAPINTASPQLATGIPSHNEPSSQFIDTHQTFEKKEAFKKHDMNIKHPSSKLHINDTNTEGHHNDYQARYGREEVMNISSHNNAESFAISRDNLNIFILSTITVLLLLTTGMHIFSKCRGG